jgi:hypothetical protein
MASPNSNNDHSNYDMRPHEETWALFNKLAVWTIIGCIIIVGGMALFLTGGHPPKPM